MRTRPHGPFRVLIMIDCFGDNSRQKYAGRIRETQQIYYNTHGVLMFLRSVEAIESTV